MGVVELRQYSAMDHTNLPRMSLKKDKTPLERVIQQLDGWIKKSEDEIAKYPLQAAKEIVQSNIEYEEKFAGKMYDYGASGRFGYETGKKFFKEKYNNISHETKDTEELGGSKKQKG